MHKVEIPQVYIDRIIHRAGRAHLVEALDGPTTALVVIDMQNFFMDDRYAAACPVARDIVPDEKDLVSERLAKWCDSGEIDLVLTTGGTGLGPRDVTPEATRAILDLEVPGIGEAIRIQTLAKTPMAMLSRSVAGVRSGTLIINLPGSPKGVRETLEVAMEAIPHGLEMIQGWRGHPRH